MAQGGRLSASEVKVAVAGGRARVGWLNHTQSPYTPRTAQEPGVQPLYGPGSH